MIDGPEPVFADETLWSRTWFQTLPSSLELYRPDTFLNERMERTRFYL